MIDQRVSEGIKCKFFNQEAFTTTIPAQFVKKFNTQIIPVYIERFNVCQNLSIECHDFLEGNEYKTHKIVKDFLISKKFKILKNIRNKTPVDKYFIYASK